MAGKTFSIATVFKLIDKITAPMRRATLSTKKFSNAFKSDIRRAQYQVAALATSIKTKLMGAITMVASTGFFALAMGIGYAVREFISFDHAIIQAGAKFKDLKPGTEEYKKSLKELGVAARKVGAETQFSATEAGKGLDFLAMAGFKSKQAIALLPKTVELATATSMDLARATDIASDSLGAFGLMTNNTAQLTKNLARVNDVFAKTTTSTNVTLEMLFEAVKKGGPALTGMGQSIETFSAATGILAQSGIKGGEAGTALRNTMLSLAKPTGEAATIVKKLGINVKDQKGNFKDLFVILKDLEKGMAKYGNVEKAAMLKTVFGKRTVTALNVVLASMKNKTKDGVSELEALRNTLEKSKGSAAAMAAEMRKSLLNRLKILGSTLIEVGLKFVSAFSKQGGNALDSITESISKFDVKPITDGILKTISFIKDTIDVLKPFKPLIMGIIIALGIYKLAVFAAAIAQGVFNAAMTANPIGLVIVAIGLLVGAIVWLTQNWDKVKKAFWSAWEFIMDSLDIPLVKYLGLLFFPLITIPLLIAKNWETVKPILIGVFDRVVEGVQSAIVWFKALMDDPLWGKVLLVISPFITIPVLIYKHWSSIKEWFGSFFDTMGNWVDILATKFSFIIDFLGKVKDGVGSVGSFLARIPKFMLTRQPNDENDDEDIDESDRTKRAIALANQQNVLTSKIVQKSVSESINRSEVTIKDTTGKATMNNSVPGVKLVSSGAI